MIHLMLEIVGVWLIAILMGMPLFASMGLAAFAFVIFGGLSPSIVPQKMAQAMNSFPLVAAPLFILMGNLLGAAKLTDRIVRFATSLVGALRGGYAHASILSSMIFAGMVGSAVADAAGTGAVETHGQAQDNEILAQESKLADTFKAGGMTVIQPDIESFRKPVLASVPAKFESKWGKGLWERIAAL